MKYKEIMFDNGETLKVKAFQTVGNVYRGVTQGRGKLLVDRRLYDEANDREADKLTGIYLDYFSKVGLKHGYSDEILDRLSFEWGRFQGKDSLITEKSAVEKINKALESTGYEIVMMPGFKKGRILFSNYVYKETGYIKEVEQLCIKGGLMGINARHTNELINIRFQLEEIMKKAGRLEVVGGVEEYLITEDFGLFHNIRVDLEFVLTKLGVENFIKDMSLRMRYEVK